MVRALLESEIDDPSPGWKINGLNQRLAHIHLDLPGDWILNVWDSGLASGDGVDTVHDHPWPVWARIVSGELRQHRFLVASAGERFAMVTSVDADGCGPKSGPLEYVCLVRGPLEVYGPGEVYEQTPDELHLSLPLDGAVTLARRFALPDPPIRQRVAWPADSDRDPSSTKRAATGDEVRRTLRLALDTWNETPRTKET